MSTPEQPQASRLRVGRWLPAQLGRRPARPAEALTVPLPRVVEPAPALDPTSAHDPTSAQDPAPPSPRAPVPARGRSRRRRRGVLALAAAVATALAAATGIALHRPGGGPAGTTPALIGGSTAAPQPAPTTAAASASPPASPRPSAVRSASPSPRPSASASATTLDVAASPGPPPPPVSYEAEAPVNTRLGQVRPRAVADASGGQVVGWIGGGSANVLRFNAITAVSAGPHQVTVYYVAGEVRTALVSVNGAAPVSVTFPVTGGWSTVGSYTLTLTLTAGANTVALSNPTAWAPDIDRIVVA
jgi:alpha-galactosidase-like CBM13-containing protein